MHILAVIYAPEPDGLPDPGEICWAWVPYEDDPQRGKDRPVLVLSAVDGMLACLMLTSKDHDRDAADEAHYGRFWMDVGTGAWDREGRPSEVRLDRLLVMPESAVRREGAAQETYDVVREIADAHGVEPAQVRIAWNLALGPHVLAIPGAGDLQHLEQNVAAASLRLTDDELAALSSLG